MKGKKLVRKFRIKIAPKTLKKKKKKHRERKKNE